ncbi:hypothetical protein ACCO45_005286 [Purpureocillium lilacinum]|uniref:Uncharacterized protein n=1 Tax=Purpureocillium lilacinum TaxID=33203 RepID=A0ACC4DV25_PURLI
MSLELSCPVAAMAGTRWLISSSSCHLRERHGRPTESCWATGRPSSQSQHIARSKLPVLASTERAAH